MESFGIKFLERMVGYFVALERPAIRSYCCGLAHSNTTAIGASWLRTFFWCLEEFSGTGQNEDQLVKESIGLVVHLVHTNPIEATFH